MSTVTKALSLLDLFSEARPRLGLTELHQLSGRDKATVYRHVCALEKIGFVEQDPKSRAYYLGHHLERLAATRRKTVKDADTIAPIVDWISTNVGELVHVTRLNGDDLSTIYHTDLGGHAVRVELEPDLVMPLLTTSTGKAIMSCWSEERQNQVITEQQARFGIPPMPQTDEIRETLRAAAASGYVTSTDELEYGVSSVGIPLFDNRGTSVAACAVAYPTARYSVTFLENCLAALFTKGPELVARMGGVLPGDILHLWSAGVPDMHKLQLKRTGT